MAAIMCGKHKSIFKKSCLKNEKKKINVTFDVSQKQQQHDVNHVVCKTAVALFT
jgi:hypothetical protein